MSPAELMMGRRLRSKLHPDLARKVKDKQTLQKALHDRHSKESLLTLCQAA